MMMHDDKMGSRRLSADAPPFFPQYESDREFLIYNDGVPSMILPTESDLCRILHGIQDEALDEGYPPDANDAAELDLVEEFVEVMAHLAFLEEIELHSRQDFCHIKKRWEARRAEGLKGRPRPAKHYVHASSHSQGMHLKWNTACRAIVAHSHHQQAIMADKMRQREMTRRDPVLKKKMPAAMSRPAPIQQPRKQY